MAYDQRTADLEVALRPFAEAAALYFLQARDDYGIAHVADLTVGDLRRAARLLGLPECREDAE